MTTAAPARPKARRRRLACPPRLQHAPKLKQSRGPEAVDLYRQTGGDLDDWQIHVLDRGLCLRRNRWGCFEVAIICPRQNGKDEILIARELLALFGEQPEPLVIHSAHEFATASEHFMRLESAIWDAGWGDTVKFRRSHGEEAIIRKDGRARLVFKTRTKSALRGFAGASLVVLNEAMILPDAAMGAGLPILRAQSRKIPGVQVWYAGSAVDQSIHEHGLHFTRLRERGMKGTEHSLAFFEWSIALDNPELLTDELMFDPKVRAQVTPGSARIAPEHFDRECRTLPRRETAVELFCVGDWPSTDPQAEGPLRPARWLELVDPRSRLDDPVVLAFDVSPERRWSIAAAGPNGQDGFHVEIPATASGVAGLAQRVVDLAGRHDVAEVVADGYGPAASVVAEVERAGVKVRTLNTQEIGQACGRLLDLVADGRPASEARLRHLGSQELLDAIRGAKTRPLGDAWAWSRKHSGVDISSLVAATLALFAAVDQETGTIAIY